MHGTGKDYGENAQTDHNLLQKRIHTTTRRDKCRQSSAVAGPELLGWQRLRDRNYPSTKREVQNRNQNETRY